MKKFLCPTETAVICRKVSQQYIREWTEHHVYADADRQILNCVTVLCDQSFRRKVSVHGLWENICKIGPSDATWYVISICKLSVHFSSCFCPNPALQVMLMRSDCKSGVILATFGE